ncbi:MAG: ATP-binding protein [Gammaproteobacteria bacterium]|nr:ATP-binding protein [Gammaproteobacteria bacterium]MDT8371462.1 ATP-binding protein [Gammaproteobacteria bacterium]
MRSIRTYLLLALLAIITLVTFVSLLKGYQSSIEKAQQLFDDRLKNIAGIIANANQDTQPRTAGVFELSPGVFFQIWSDDFMLLAHSNNAPLIQLFDIDNDSPFNDINFSGYRWRSYTLQDTTLNRWIIVGERDDIRYTLAENVVLASIIPIVLAIPVAALIIWVAIGLGLKPLRELSEQLNNKQADDLSPVVMRETPKELTQLVTTTNALLDRLNAAFLREQQFSTDAAHELRTPISALKVQVHNLQTAHKFNDQEIESLALGIDRMGHVIEQILALYRHSPDQPLMKLTPLDLCAISQHVIAKHYDQIALKQQQISMVGEEKCLIKGNKFALETLLDNVILNASKYTPDSSEIRIGIFQNNQSVKLVIEDSGPGVEEHDYDRVFERFYRGKGDQHDSGTVGCGLGLAIVKHIVSIHHATISLDRCADLGGLKIVITFPK